MMARHRDVITSQSKTRERIRDLAEVYTHEREVNAMLDLVPDMFPSAERPRDIGRTFLEPACGAGNFLIGILDRKLAFVKFGDLYRSVATFETAVLRALSSIYGIDIDPENVEQSRQFLKADVEHHMNLQLNTVSATEGFWSAVDAILCTNVILADTLKDAQSIRLVEYHWQRKAGFVRRTWSYLEEPDKQFNLFSTHDDPTPGDAVALHYSLLASHPGPTRGYERSRGTAVTQAQLAKQIRTGQHVPDILDCLAQLSNDEVPTPPKLARNMLDILPAEVWSNPDYRWLDPFCKSGIFLREAAARLLEGLSEQIPNFDARREHIYREMLWGTSITEMTGMISRRSLYYSRDASGPASVVQMETEDGNLPFVRTHHTYPKKKDGTVTGGCTNCGAPLDLERGEARENHAYSFIHGAYPTKEMQGMKFDVIVGNPPYQLKDGGHSASATQIYQHFVDAAIGLQPRYVLMITKSNWFSGGKGLDKFRSRMLSDRSIRHLVDFPKLYDVFPGVKIRGGVSYFLWDRDYNGPCTVQTMWDGQPLGPAVERYLDAYDVLVRRNEAVSVLEKVRSFRLDGEPEATLNARVSSMKPFGLRTFFHGASSAEALPDPIKLYGSQRVSWVDRGEIPQNAEWVDDWKVLVSRVQGTSAAVETLFLGNPIVSGPGEACTETYVVAGRFETEIEAERYATYLRSRFARFLVSLRKSTQDSPKDVYGFIPDLPMDREWDDAALYARYGLTPDEIAFIESHVKERVPPAGPKDGPLESESDD